MEDDRGFMQKNLDSLVLSLSSLQGCQHRGEGGRELSLAITNLEQAIMWLRLAAEGGSVR